MSKFIKLGTLYVRPEDIVSFQSNSMNVDHTKVRFRDGSERNLDIKAADLATLVNEATK